MDRDDAFEARIVRMDGDAQFCVVAGETDEGRRLLADQRDLLILVRPVEARMADEGEERGQTVEIHLIKAFFVLFGQHPQVMDDGDDMDVLAGEMGRPFVVLVLHVKQQLVQIDGMALRPFACFGQLLFNRPQRHADRRRSGFDEPREACAALLAFFVDPVAELVELDGPCREDVMARSSACSESTRNRGARSVRRIRRRRGRSCSARPGCGKTGRRRAACSRKGADPASSPV